MAAIYLLLGPSPSSWSTYVAVGLVVMLLGGILFGLGGGPALPIAGQAQEPFLLSIFLLALGGVTVLAGFVLWSRRRSHPLDEPSTEP